MRTIYALMVFLAATGPALAGGHGKVVIVRNFVIPQFAVPVGVPLAIGGAASYQYGATAYGSQRYQQQTSSAALAAKEDALADRVAAKVLAALGRTGAFGMAQVSLSQGCIKCHGPTRSEKGFRVDRPISAVLRLKAISKMLSDDPKKVMPPPSVKITDKLRGEVIRDLSIMPQVAAMVEPPIPPKP